MGAGRVVKCALCNDIIQSKHVHDYVKCSCGEIFVDGGDSYMRCGATDWNNFLVEQNGEWIPFNTADGVTTSQQRYKSPLYVVLIGPDGSGKTTIMNELKKLVKENTQVHFTKEPKFPEYINLIKEETDPHAKALLFTADRHKHYNEVLKPFFESNEIIISDRSFICNIAYQTADLILPGSWGDIGEMFNFVHMMQPDKMKHPHLVIFVTCDPEVAVSRCTLRNEEMNADRYKLLTSIYTIALSKLGYELESNGRYKYISVLTNKPVEQTVKYIVDEIQQLYMKMTGSSDPVFR